MLNKSFIPRIFSGKILKIVLSMSVAYILLGVYSSSKILASNTDVNKSVQYIDIVLVGLLIGLFWHQVLSAAKSCLSYSRVIGGSKESSAFLAISNGMWFLFVSVVLTSFLNLFRVPPTDSALYGVMTTIIYYGAGLFSLVYFTFLGKAGLTFTNYVDKRSQYKYLLVAAYALVSLAALFIWNSSSSVNSTGNVNHVLNYVPSSIVLFSLFIPLIIAWCLGLSGVLGAVLYQKHVSGTVYKKSMIKLTVGVVALVVVSIARHFSDHLSGSVSYLNLPADFPRIVILLTIALFAAYSVNSGVAKLLKIERAK